MTNEPINNSSNIFWDYCNQANEQVSGLYNQAVNSELSQTVQNYINDTKPFFESNAAYINPISTLAGGFVTTQSVVDLFVKEGIKGKLAATAKLIAGASAIYLPSLNGEQTTGTLTTNFVSGLIGTSAAILVAFKEKQNSLKAVS